VEWRQLKSLSLKLISQKENRDKDRLNDHLPPSKKRPSHASQERERDTSLGSRLEGKESKEGRKNTPPKLNREKRKRTLIHPQMEMNQNPAQRQKGWGLVRKDPTYKNNTGGQSCQKQTRTPPRPLALTESTWNKGDS